MGYRSLVLGKYKSIAEFADAIGWSRNKASRIVNGVQEPDAEEMEQMAELFGINTADRFMEFFFARLSTKWTDGGGKSA